MLLDFWATWCGPCREETPHLKAVHEAFGRDDRLVMIGLSLDEEPTAPARYAAEHGMTWHQGFLGDWQEAKLPGAFGVQGIPSIMLIGPDGKVIATDLRGARDQGGRGRRPGEVNPRRLEGSAPIPGKK